MLALHNTEGGIAIFEDVVGGVDLASVILEEGMDGTHHNEARKATAVGASTATIYQLNTMRRAQKLLQYDMQKRKLRA